MNTEEIGKILKARRKTLNLNQQELSELAGIGINTLVAIERGDGNPKISTMMAIADTLGLEFKIGLKELQHEEV